MYGDHPAALSAARRKPITRALRLGQDSEDASPDAGARARDIRAAWQRIGQP